MTLGWSHDEQENSERGRWFTTGARGGGGVIYRLVTFITAFKFPLVFYWQLNDISLAVFVAGSGFDVKNTILCLAVIL